jgi:hypothetical protein
MKRQSLAIIGVVSAIVTMMAITTSSASAQTQSGGGDALRIAPVRTDLTIKPGETKNIVVNVTNVTKAPAELKGIVNDFGPGDDETGQPRIYLDEKAASPAHGLKKYIKPVGDLSLQPQEQKAVTVTISIPKDAAGGGYYGAVRFAPASTGSKNSVSLSGSVGSLILVTVPGDVVEKAAVKSFNVARQNGDNLGKASNLFTNGNKDSKGKGIQAVLRVQNSGNVQVAPFGKAILKRSGKEIASYELNNVTPRGTVLPDSTRRFQIDLGDKTSSFGRYTLEGNFGYGSQGQLILAKTSFFVLPIPYIIAIVVLFGAILTAILVFPRMLKSHDRKLLRKVRGGKR